MGSVKFKALFGLFEGGGGEPSSLLLLLEGEDGWSVGRGTGGGGVRPTRVVVPPGRTKYNLCGSVGGGGGEEEDDGGVGCGAATGCNGCGGGSGVLSTSAAPLPGSALGMTQATGG